jgi:SagB-type dehydrogenase family enzyme
MTSSDRLRAYHEQTKHSLESLRRGPRGLDWGNQPRPFKLYRDLSAIPLPRDRSPSGVGALSAIFRSGPSRANDRPLSLVEIARLLDFSLGIVRRRRLGDGSFIHFRAAPCTGALYHVDAYLVCGGLDGLEPGVYHFGPQDFSLRRLRAGDFRGTLVEAAGGDDALSEAPAILVFASTWWRNAWKYRARAYRHVFWDSGTILAQLLAEANALGHSARLLVAFVDREVEGLLGLEPGREGVASLVALGSGCPPLPAAPVEPIRFETEPLSRREIAYPEIQNAHAASSLDDPLAVRRWRGRAADARPLENVPEGLLLPLPPPDTDSVEPLEAVILRRGSTRLFSRQPISARQLSTLLSAAAAPLDADYRADPSQPLVSFYVIANAVDGLAPGAYRWHPGRGALECVAEGEFRREAGFLALGQELAADAAVNLYTIADLDQVLGALGGRGYRAAELEGGIAGGRVYLAAYAQGFGATGLTFFDDDVCRFLGLDAGRYGVMFLAAAGVEASTPGGAR